MVLIPPHLRGYAAGMPNYRRAAIRGGTYFFTLVTHARRRFLTDDSVRELLGEVIRSCRRDRPFTVDAIVLLPDHLHAIWTLSPGDTDYSGRWAWIKREFSARFLKLGGREIGISKGRRRERRRGIWQPRFREHALEDEEDFERHFDYIHYNPVKHGLVRCPRHWPWSSFHRWVKAGVYESCWACGEHGPPASLHNMTQPTGELPDEEVRQ